MVWNDVRGGLYDVAVDLQGAMRSAVLARWAGARVVYGAAEPRESPASLWYTRKVAARGRHVVEQNLSVAEALVERPMGFWWRIILVIFLSIFLAIFLATPGLRRVSASGLRNTAWGSLPF